MSNHTLLTVGGADQPGIAAIITDVLLKSDCGIENARMARLGPNFTFMVMIKMPKGMASQQLSQQLDSLTKERGFRLHLQDLSPEQADNARSSKPQHIIHIYGANRMDIVHGITKHLADRGVNISNLHTEVIQHKTPLYVMMVEVEIPPAVESGKLQDELGKIGKEVEVAVSLKPKSDARF